MPFFKRYDPPETLSKIIRKLHVYHANWHTEKNLPAPFVTCLANTEQNLYFFVKDPIRIVTEKYMEIPVPRVVITGPKYIPVGLLYGRDHLMIKVAFHPTGTYRLLGIQMQQTVNAGLDASSLWGEEASCVLHRLQQTSSYDCMVEIVSDFIQHKLENSCRSEEPIDTVAIQMLNPLNNYSLEEWSAMACLSLRQFERNFITRVGVSPKLFIRIVRFEYAMKIKNDFPEKPWSEIALECGYTDSSHLLRAFKEFAAFPPSSFYSQPTSGYSDFPTG